MMTPPFALVIPSELHLVPHVRALVKAVCQSAGIDEDETHAVVLAINEAANNVIRHAHPDRPDAPIRIECSLSSDGIEIVIEDEGDPFNIDEVPQMDPSELRIGGRGVFLMRALMDELSTQRRDERGNILRMVRRWRAGNGMDDAR